MKQRITWIRPDDLEAIKASCETDKDGNLIVPDTLEIYQKPTKEEQIKMEIARLEKELAGMKEPTKEELVELGKDTHYYYEIKKMLDFYYKDLQAYQELTKEEG